MRLINTLKRILSPCAGNARHWRPSYSQCGEDSILAFIFRSLAIDKPSYLDIGAHHPHMLNNTFIFYTQGGRGINIEPDPDLFPVIARARPKDTNLQIGIGSERGEVPLYVMDVPTLNTFSEREARKYCQESGHRIKKVVPVQVDTISNTINYYNGGVFPDLLTLDAEGMDEIILDSIDFTKTKPLVMCVETLEYTRGGRPQKNSTIAEKLSRDGYFAYADTYINTIFVLRDCWDERQSHLTQPKE